MVTDQDAHDDDDNDDDDDDDARDTLGHNAKEMTPAVNPHEGSLPLLSVFLNNVPEHSNIKRSIVARGRYSSRRDPSFHKTHLALSLIHI